MKYKRVFINFVPVLLWMVVIFLFSAQPASISNNNNHFLIQFLNKCGINLESILGYDFSNFLVRKAGHITEYTILFILWFYAFNKSKIKLAMFWSAVLNIIYSASDEIHQLFIPGRSGSVRDVLIDSIGIIIGSIIIFLLKRLLMHRGEARDSKFVSNKIVE